MMLWESETLTPTKVLSSISQVEVFERYLGIRVKFRKAICSPLRPDRNPSCSFYFNRSGRLILRDWATGERLDVFSLVMKLKHVHFADAIQMLYYGFEHKPEIVLKAEHVPTVIETREREWLPHDEAYWSSYGINTTLLDHYEVVPINYCWLNGNVVVANAQHSYKYVLVDGVKIYQPNTKVKFICNTSEIQGRKQLKRDADTCFIMSSMKDGLTLVSLRPDYTFIAPSSESAKIEDNVISYLKDNYNNVVVMYDNDETGMKYSQTLVEKHGLNRIHTPLDGPKDLSDMRKECGSESCYSLLNSI